MQKSVRHPAVAGAFYPQNPDELRREVKKYIDSAGLESFDTRGIRAVVVPHAGYVYSGSAAGYGYAVLKKVLEAGVKIERVFLLGASHRAYVSGIGFSSVKEWRTPMGSVRVSRVVANMIEEQDFCIENNRAHESEHSLEVQLPFLQEAFGENPFEIVPMLVSDISAEKISNVLEKYVADSDILIVSSDLSHYLPYDRAVQIDERTIELVLGLRSDELLEQGDACGIVPIASVVSLARTRHWEPHLLKYANSGDTTGEKEAVVGYAAISFF